MSYNIIAVNAARMAVAQKINPLQAWQTCAKAMYQKLHASEKKPCPKNAFLGLCDEGKVQGIAPGKYSRSIDNKRYALRALELISNSRNRDFISSELWSEVLKSEADKGKRHNGQMDVVIGLWDAGLIN